MYYEELLLIWKLAHNTFDLGWTMSCFSFGHVIGLLAIWFGFILVSDWFMLDLLVKCVLVLVQMVHYCILGQTNNECYYMVKVCQMKNE